MVNSATLGIEFWGQHAFFCKVPKMTQKLNFDADVSIELSDRKF